MLLLNNEQVTAFIVWQQHGAVEVLCQIQVFPDPNSPLSSKLKLETIKSANRKVSALLASTGSTSHCQSKCCQIKNKDEHCCPLDHCMCENLNAKFERTQNVKAQITKCLFLNEITKFSSAKLSQYSEQ